MPAIFLRCDRCGVDYDGEEYGPRGERRMKGLDWGGTPQLAVEARARGWTGPLVSDLHRGADKTPDLCPACSAQTTCPNLKTMEQDRG